ncbi:Eco57I restriction-modification methylase domain-containing protein [Haloferax chudinovii]|uniref:site-specific DNA-methyltransferase (adenine-specific) n=1 Tax=Haloferax chudinovii TaxID=1109010 RepID=A0ABD5XIG3_9EURY
MSQATLGSAPYLNSNLFSGYYLDERVADRDAWDCDEEAEAVFEELRTLWRNEKTLVEGYNEDTLLGSWIDQMLDVLGFDTIQETSLPNSGGFIDRVLYDSPEDRRDAMAMKQDGMLSGTFGRASALLEAKQWDAGFNKTFSEQRQYRDASHQVKYYLERTPDSLKWGILTNGRKWRLYGIKDYETQTYYEVDLPELLESGSVEAFKYFYVFFRPDAFREVAGTSFLDTVWNESETAAQELGEDLQDNVFTALRVLGEGFVETNNLGIGPEDDDKRKELKEQSLVLLYRLMFVLYAESRGLISPNEPGKRSEFEENFSLDELRREIHDEITSGGSFDDFSELSTSMWGRLEDLFRLVDAGEESLGIPPYNGGLFERESHEFLAEHEVANRYIAEVVYRLGTTHAEDGSGFVLADYADLDTRHLGTIYEGLLEHEFRIAPEQFAAVTEGGGQVWKPATKVSVADAIETVEEGELYVVNDNGERKATGSYYTPDYVVTYIVEETIDPLVGEIEKGLDERGLEPGTQEYVFRFADEILDLSVLDPAMGSGHFLTKATGYLAERIMELGREVEETAGVLNEQDIRRRVSRECIYGVDINGMAVELAKLSMWLETLAEEKPLAFLDHHLKDGNSLVGSDITEVLSEDNPEEDDGQITLFQAVARARQRTLEHVMDRMSELLAIDNEVYEDIKSMEELYAEIREDPLYGRLFELANVHTAELFGLEVPDGVYEKMANAIEDEDDWSEIRGEDWYQTAQAMADEENFFHWELEYPEIFFGAEGEKREDAGFDAVIGNPPYVRQEQLTRNKPFFKSKYESYDSSADLYTYFLEKFCKMVSPGGDLGYVVSNKFLHAEYGSGLRDFLSSEVELRTAIDFHSLPVFGRDVSAYPLIFIAEKRGSDENVTLARPTDLDFQSVRDMVSNIGYEIPKDEFIDSGWRIQSAEVTEILDRISERSDKLTEYLDVDLRRGLLTGLNDAFIFSGELGETFSDELPHIRNLLKGSDVHRYHTEYQDRHIIAIPSGWTKSTAGVDTEEAAWQWFCEEFPEVANHLSQFESDARDRHDRGECWWELRPCDYYDELEETKIVYPVIADGPNFTMDTDGYYINDKLYSIPQEDYALLSILNSNLTRFWVKAELSGLRGGYQEFRAVHVEQVPVSKGISDNEELADLSREAISLRNQRSALNTSLLDHLGSYNDGPTLAEVGLTQPPQNAADSVLQETAEQKPNIRVGHAEVVRESNSTVEVRLTARYKPDEDSSHETDRWGYTETDSLSALRITDLTENEVKLIETFVPLAVDKAGGFANFRETATKTNSLVDRLKDLTLPQVEDVRDGLENYLETMNRAEKLEEKIEQTDTLIDEIVYELYGLTEEDIEIIEEAVA